MNSDNEPERFTTMKKETTYTTVKDGPRHVWVFTAEQAWDGDVADTVVKAFATEEAARKYMREFLLDGGDESIRKYVEDKDWEVEFDLPDLYRAYEDGDYSLNHIELTITKCEIEK